MPSGKYIVPPALILNSCILATLYIYGFLMILRIKKYYTSLR